MGLVFAWRDHCKSCGADKQGLGGTGIQRGPHTRPGDWMCPACGEISHSSKKTCRSCGAKCNLSLESRVGVKPGDWTCPKCGDLVFASKAACSMCKTPKPSPDAPPSGYQLVAESNVGFSSARAAPYQL